MFTHAPRGSRPSAEILEGLRGASPSTLGHYTDCGFLRGLRPNLRRFKLVGSAITVRLPHLDSTALHYALDSVEPGDVLVVDQSGDHERACWGSVVTVAARARGAVGALIDGSTTDVAEIAAMEFPTFSRGASALTTRILGLEGSVNIPVTVGGVTVMPGDVIFGDENGVVAMSAAAAASWLPILTADEADEPSWVTRLEAGASLAEMSGARALFEKGMRAAPGGDG